MQAKLFVVLIMQNWIPHMIVGQMIKEEPILPTTAPNSEPTLDFDSEFEREVHELYKKGLSDEQIEDTLRKFLHEHAKHKKIDPKWAILMHFLSTDGPEMTHDAAHIMSKHILKHPELAAQFPEPQQKDLEKYHNEMEKIVHVLKKEAESGKDRRRNLEVKNLEENLKDDFVIRWENQRPVDEYEQYLENNVYVFD